MQEVLLLYQALQIHFTKANQAKLKCLAQAVLAILAVKNCSLAQIATGFKGKTKANSHFRRLQRWVAAPLIQLEVLAKWLVNLFDFPEQMTLALDRTNWKFGKTNINVFMLTGCYKRLALPLFWMLLSKRGNSSDEEKKSLLQKFVNVFGVERIKYLLGDREFAGVAWFKYLCVINLPFIFRIKGVYVTTNSQGKKVEVKRLFLHLQAGESLVLKEPKLLLGQRLYLAGLRLPSGQLRIVASNRYNSDVLSIYMQREQIEYLFGALKTRGFNFEDTHLTHPDRISNLIIIMAIAYAWSYRCGDLMDDEKPIKIKNNFRRVKSIFRYGYDIIRNVLQNIDIYRDEFLQMLDVFIHPGKQFEHFKLVDLL